MANPGKMATQSCDFPPRDNAKSLPQVSTSAGIPKPINDKNDSTKIADAIPNATAINTGDNAFGIACLNKMRHLE